MFNFFKLKNSIKKLKNSNSISWNVLSGPILLLMILSMMVLPLPPWILDLFFTFNIVLSIIIILVSMFNTTTLNFSSFPTVLLFSTLLRLGLNVASTRIILLEGHTGSGSAGNVIQSFGHFLVGGNFAIGMIVFVILVVINFMVITKGAGRVAEVGARFALDGMPGKQMAIDADLNAGLIGEAEAKKRRLEVACEADFYGSMDGASKFVRGDAIAGILIMIINIIGGLVVGVVQHGLSVKEAAEVYTLLTIGDGLVAQIPALVISTAAGVIVTRVTTKKNVGEQMISELFNNPQVILLSGLVLGILGLVPGMPNLVFLCFTGFLFLLSYYLYSTNINQSHFSFYEQFRKSKESFYLKEVSWDDVRLEDPIGIELGSSLIYIVDESKRNNLLIKIRGIRKKIAQKIGFLPPIVHIQNNHNLPNSCYKIFLKGIKIVKEYAFYDKLLAINTGNVKDILTEKIVKEPIFGMPACWIDHSLRIKAKNRGYSIIDPVSLVATHLNYIIKKNLHELFGRQEAQKLLDRVSKVAPKLVEEFIPNIITLTSFHKILKNLLVENVPIRDIITIIETIIENVNVQNNVKELTSYIRISLRKSILQRICKDEKNIQIRVLDIKLENILLQSIHPDSYIIEPGLADYLIKDLTRSILDKKIMSKNVILVVKHSLRSFLSNFLRPYFEDINVLSQLEIGDQKNIQIIDIIGSNLNKKK
ncbi:flagellar biosynthesis protein FlhA [Buchnera aphidicola]|uniref:Flagellar biosynthesis protein FlhA n=1 Tax=Buchnera aphidicola (Anoecia oenotherae) TaxID=1241833 RepID=A0A4D6XXZ7_9GAMM|nr:flagellar biosynthesis protein FlhA [Buchnera aphidicola]QCI19318.1 flagellar biosynthesis protein FlhA [Buchnera aphidicola (Anoecia oenotherae)]